MSKISAKGLRCYLTTSITSIEGNSTHYDSVWWSTPASKCKVGRSGNRIPNSRLIEPHSESGAIRSNFERICFKMKRKRAHW